MNHASDLDPISPEDRRICAEEEFRVDVQFAIRNTMRRKSISNKDLAARLGVSPQRVSQFFTDRCNITVRTLAGIFHVLGEQCELKVPGVPELPPRTACAPQLAEVRPFPRPVPLRSSSFKLLESDAPDDEATTTKGYRPPSVMNRAYIEHAQDESQVA